MDLGVVLEQAHRPQPPGFRHPQPRMNPAATGSAAGRVTVTIQQAQRLAQVSRRTIYNWLSADKLEYVRTAGGSVRIFEDTLFRAPAPRP